jgi:hypothetical protein
MMSMGIVLDLARPFAGTTETLTAHRPTRRAFTAEPAARHRPRDAFLIVNSKDSPFDIFSSAYVSNAGRRIFLPRFSVGADFAAAAAGEAVPVDVVTPGPLLDAELPGVGAACSGDCSVGGAGASGGVFGVTVNVPTTVVPDTPATCR